MKNRLSFFGLALFVAVCSLLMPACRKDESKEIDRQLSSAVAGLTFPQKLNDNTTLVGCTYADKVLTFRCEVDKSQFAAMDADAKRAETLDKLRTGLFPRNLIRNVVKAKASIRYIYVNDKDSVMFSFSPDDLRLAE